MGILEVHFHDSEFSWSAETGSGDERRLSLRSGSESSGSESEGDADTPAILPKLRGVAVIALVVGAGMAYRRLRSRQIRRTAEGGGGEKRRLSLSRLR
ncbi:hypothetical protein BRC82_07505 [Halobacteriales archaeon QS_1_67_19]|nr:MAG: hypothetical protein BRC82_07505 [Halobacteriales archaeon QS_1_67_19]